MAVTVAGLAIAAVAAGCSPPTAQNLVIVCVDTLRADHLGAYGYARDTSPHIDTLARGGVVFTHVQSASNWTASSVASLMTGLFPLHHGVLLDGRVKRLGKEQTPNALVDDVETLAETLRGEGFRTLLVAGNPYVRGELERGFDESIVRHGDAAEQLPEILARLAQPGEHRFFLWWQIMDLHAPVDPPAELAHLFATDPPASFPTPRHQRWDFGQLEDDTDPSFQQYRRLRVALYDAALRAADEQIGRLLDHLEASELLESTLVVLVSDHGEAFWEHWRKESDDKDPRGIWGIGHGHSMYQELLHIPLILAGPGVEPGTRRDCPSSSVDVYPTVLAALGLTARGRQDGRILPLRDAAQAPCPRRPLWSEAPAYGHESVAVRVDDSKLIWRAPDTYEYYDLAADSGELQALTAADVPGGTRLRELIERRRTAPGARSRPVEHDATSLDELRALGYVD